MFVPRKILEYKLLLILSEDVGQGDVTASTIVEEGTRIKAQVVARQSGVVAGIEEATILLEALGLVVRASTKDGREVKENDILLNISGDARTVLSAERTVLNILSRMSGIATATRRVVEKLRGSKLNTRVASTRKTSPGFSYFDKKAVRIGGGDVHRFHLDDMVLVKENHIAVVGSIEKAIENIRKNVSFTKKIEVEVTDIAGLVEAADAGADIVMCDNFTPKKLEKAVGMLKKRKRDGMIITEASGGITLENVLEYASTGVDVVSLGELTHSAKALNINLEIALTKGSLKTS